MVSISDLSPEILLCIFKFCDFSTLCRLRETCKYFNNVVTNNRIFYEDALLTNQINKAFQKRWRTLYVPVDKWRITHNWRLGCYKRSEICRQRSKHMPWIQLSASRVWVSWGTHIYVHERRKNRTSIECITPNSAQGEDITKFSVHDYSIAIATRRGCVQIGNNEVLAKLRGPDANCVDYDGNFVVAGWRDGLVQLWNLKKDLNKTWCTPGNDSVLCCALGANNDLVLTGTAARPNMGEPAPLQVWNLHRNTHEPVWTCAQRRESSGVLSLSWLTQNAFIAAGYDCTARIWDLRIGSNAQATWIEPHGDTLYSLAWDGRHALIGGASRHGRCTLWDLRRPRRFVQMYHTSRPNALSRSSPVYSLAIDAGELWAALDTCLAILDFANPKEDTPIRNYDLPFLQVDTA